ncbi:zinc ribbon domain-containing protein [Desulfovibrio inopinatus]|uniref:zinc ribbon domain-containing protein n=1 Tax=Desulfovibrio inopinatus TaxID=102109 RepID=UPI0003FD49BB|nr:zinc ribbon domain-containing protein [Desulfovibrio inopinatus]
MNQTIDVPISSEELLSIAKRMNATYSDLSPFALIKAGAGNAPTKEINNPELISNQEELLPDVAQLLNLLTGTQAMGAVTYACDLIALHASAFHVRKGEKVKVAALMDTGKGQRLHYPPDFDNFFRTMEQFWPLTVVKRCGLDQDFPPAEAQLLLACVDATRRHYFQALANGQDIVATPQLTFQDIMAAANASLDGVHLLAPHVTNSLNLSPLGEADAQTGLEALMQKGLLRFSNSMFEIGKEAQKIAVALILPEGHLNALAACHDDNGNILKTSVFAVQGRAGAALMFSGDDDSVKITGLSPAQLFELAATLVMQPYDILRLKRVEATPETPEAGKTSKFCPACGAKHKPEAKFCSECGKPLA